MSDRSLSFGAQAAAYERGRPSYPPEAIDWLLPADARDVLDLGAGTGKLTTRLVERGLNVVAVDPIAEMLEVLSHALPQTPALLGTAEEIPLPDNSVDAVLVAQAWHWVDPERAIPEVARVLRFRYGTEGPSGAPLPPGTETVIKVPDLALPDGYDLKVTGGTVTSAEGASVLTIVADGSADSVFVKLWPKGAPEPSDDFPPSPLDPAGPTTPTTAP